MALKVEHKGLRSLKAAFWLASPKLKDSATFTLRCLPYELYWGVRNGQPFYVYKDEKAGVVYVGNEQDYQRYLVKSAATHCLL